MTSIDDFSAPHRRIWAIAGPAILANSSAPLVGLVDTWAVGHLPGAVHLAAVGVGSTIFSYILWMFGFLRMGTTGVIAQAQGRGDRDELIGTLLRSSVLAVGLGLALLILQEIILYVALVLLAPPDNVGTITSDYFHIRIWAAPATLLLYALTGVLFGLARMRAVLALQLLLNIANAILNITFVVGMGLGVPGVALGTLIAAWLAAVAGVVVITRLFPASEILLHARQAITWRMARFRKLVSVNGYLFVRTILLVTALAMIMREAAKLGEVETAASHVLMQYMLLMSLGLDGFAHAAEALAGQAFGDGRREVFRRWVRLTGLWAVIASVFYALLFWGAGAAITAALTDLQDIRDVVATIMPLMVALPLVAVGCYQFDGVYIGATEGAAMMVTMAISFVCYLLVLYWLTPTYGLIGLWGAVLILMAVRGLTQALWMPRITAKLAAHVTDR